MDVLVGWLISHIVFVKSNIKGFLFFSIGDDVIDTKSGSYSLADEDTIQWVNSLDSASKDGLDEHRTYRGRQLGNGGYVSDDRGRGESS